MLIKIINLKLQINKINNHNNTQNAYDKTLNKI